MKKIFSEKLLHRAIILLIVIQPLIDLDYLFYDFLDQFGLPRFATVVRFLILPGLLIWSFLLREPKKKRTFVFAFLYGAALLAYFVLHCRQAAALRERLDFTDNFVFTVWQELTYVLTLVLPYGAVYFIYHEHFTRKELRNIVMFLSAVISIPIVLGDLFVSAKSTYYGNTVGNFFSWFSGIYDWYHPRTLASKFLFNEGNTVGILLFMLLPLMYYFMAVEEDAKTKRRMIILIIIQSLGMQMLATRVATYGALLVPLMFLVIYAFDAFVLKEVKFQKNTALVCLCSAALFGAILNWTPAVQNQKVDAKNDVALLSNNMIQFAGDELLKAEDLVPGSVEYINFYVYAFETYGINGRYIQSVPSMYYTDFYSYQHDPKFWFDVCMMPVFDRVSGRQVETIFTKYKYKNLTSAEKILGMGYSTFMNGSIVLEKDFAMQIYLLGYAGEVLCVLPWVLICLYGFVMFVRYFRKLINLENMILVVSVCAGFGSAWLSGHMLDQFITTIFMALLAAVLLNHVHEAKESA